MNPSEAERLDDMTLPDIASSLPVTIPEEEDDSDEDTPLFVPGDRMGQPGGDVGFCTHCGERDGATAALDALIGWR